MILSSLNQCVISCLGSILCDRALFRHAFLLLGSIISEHYCSQVCTSIVLNVSISQAGLAGLDGAVERLPVVAYNQFLKSLCPLRGGDAHAPR
jgi:hypothetical protein